MHRMASLGFSPSSIGLLAIEQYLHCRPLASIYWHLQPPCRQEQNDDVLMPVAAVSITTRRPTSCRAVRAQLDCNRSTHGHSLLLFRRCVCAGGSQNGWRTAPCAMHHVSFCVRSLLLLLLLPPLLPSAGSDIRDAASALAERNQIASAPWR